MGEPVGGQSWGDAVVDAFLPREGPAFGEAWPVRVEVSAAGCGVGSGVTRTMRGAGARSAGVTAG